MKKSNYIKLSLLSFLTFSLLISCGPGKTVVKEVKTNQENVVEVITPCVGDKFQSNDKYFRGTANGSSVNMNMAKKIALRSANTFLATDIKVQITQVADDYSGQTTSGTNSSFREKLQDSTESVVDEIVSSSRTICERTTMNKATGEYTVYISRESSVENIFSKVNQTISKEEELRVDYDYEKFKETFDKVMEKRRNN
jgi:hypothetical protein